MIEISVSLHQAISKIIVDLILAVPQSLEQMW